jgi:predicted O-methyltransferase YrrM
MNRRMEQLKSEPRCIEAAQGAGNFVAGLFDLIATVKPKSVLEIGSNRGVSTEAFLLSGAHVTVIDPWETAAGAERDAFAEFMHRCGAYPGLRIIKGMSPAAVRDLNVNFDLAYIDGAHDYISVKADIAVCAPIARWLAGHDYFHPPVRRAVDEFGDVSVFGDTSWLITERHNHVVPA